MGNWDFGTLLLSVYAEMFIREISFRLFIYFIIYEVDRKRLLICSNGTKLLPNNFATKPIDIEKFVKCYSVPR